jgi:hypothetical protein
MRSWNNSTDSAIRPTGVPVRPLLFQQLHHNRGRGHGKCKAEHDGRGGSVTGDRDGSCDRQRRQHELGNAQPEHIAAQRPQSRQRKFEPQHEQQKHHAELGEGADARAILDGQVTNPRMFVGEQTEPVGADRDAGDEKGQHGPDTRAVKQGNDQPGDGEKDEKILEPGLVLHLAHPRRLSRRMMPRITRPRSPPQWRRVRPPPSIRRGRRPAPCRVARRRPCRRAPPPPCAPDRRR